MPRRRKDGPSSDSALEVCAGEAGAPTSDNAAAPLRKRQRLDDALDLMSVEDVIACLGVSRATLYRLMESRDLRYVQVSKRKRRFKRADVVAYVERNRR